MFKEKNSREYANIIRELATYKKKAKIRFTITANW